MLVKELIEMLSKYNPDKELTFSCGIESGRSYDSCSVGDLSIEMEDLEDDEIRESLMRGMEFEDEDDMDEEDKELLEKLILEYTPRLNINISGECTDYQ